MKHFIAGKLVAWDTETTGLKPWHGDKPFAFSFCNEQGDTAYFEFPVNPHTRQVIYDSRLRAVRHLLEDERVTKVAHNSKFDIRMVAKGCDITVAGPGGACVDGGLHHETIFAAHACNSDEINYKLKPLAAKYVGIPVADEKGLKKVVNRLRRKAKLRGWLIGGDNECDYWLPGTVYRHRKLRVAWGVGQWEARRCRRYAIQDVKRTMLLWMMYRELMNELKVRDTYDREMLLWPEAYRMEERGVVCYADRLAAVHDRASLSQKKNIEKIEKNWGWSGINMNSPQQVARMLYGKQHCGLKKPDVKASKTKKVSKLGTDMRTLQYIRGEPVVDAIFRYRATKKGLEFCETYQSYGVPEGHDPNQLVIHGGFKQVGPNTGRWACGEPNLQQVSEPDSSRHGQVMPVREPFGPRPGFVWISADYSGMEIRVFADVADEESMLEEIRHGRDVHSLAIRKVYGGENNPLAIRQAVAALALDGRSDEWPEVIEKARQELGVKKNPSFKDALKLAAKWLTRWDWDIEKAEKSLGRKNTRGRCKQISFLKVYGGGADSASIVMACPVEEARETMREYDRMFPRMRVYSNELQRQARRDGGIRTRWNRWIPVDPNRAYAAVNYIVQGSCADLMKHAQMKCQAFFHQNRDLMVGLRRWKVPIAVLEWDRKLDADTVMTIHDELVFEIRRVQCTHAVVRRIDTLMSDSDGHLRVSMPVEPRIITRGWDDKPLIKGYKYGR